jgi:hypothetical protein
VVVVLSIAAALVVAAVGAYARDWFADRVPTADASRVRGSLAARAGRVAFWVGYLVHPTARAFGMVLTGLPTIAAYVWLVGDAVANRLG